MKDGKQKNISPRLRIAIAVSAAAALILIAVIISLFAGREGTSAPDSQIGTGGISQTDSSADSADYADITRSSTDGSKAPAPSGIHPIPPTARKLRTAVRTAETGTTRPRFPSISGTGSSLPGSLRLTARLSRTEATISLRESLP